MENVKPINLPYKVLKKAALIKILILIKIYNLTMTFKEKNEWRSNPVIPHHAVEYKMCKIMSK